MNWWLLFSTATVAATATAVAGADVVVIVVDDVVVDVGELLWEHGTRLAVY